MSTTAQIATMTLQMQWYDDRGSDDVWLGFYRSFITIGLAV